MALAGDLSGKIPTSRSERAERVYQQALAHHNALKYDRSNAPPAQRVAETRKAMMPLVAGMFPGKSFDTRAFLVEAIKATELPRRRGADARAAFAREAKGFVGRHVGAPLIGALARLSTRVGRTREGKVALQGLYARNPASVFLIEEFVKDATDAQLRTTTAHELTHALLGQHPATPQPRPKKAKWNQLYRVLRAVARDHLEQAAVNEALAETVGAVARDPEAPVLSNADMVTRLLSLWNDPVARRQAFGQRSARYGVLRGIFDNRLAHELADEITLRLLREQIDEISAL